MRSSCGQTTPTRPSSGPRRPERQSYHQRTTFWMGDCVQVGSPTLTEIRSRLCSASDNAPREQPSEPASCACPNVLSRYCGQETAARAGLASLVECPPHELKPTTALGAGRAQACQRQCPVPGRRRTAASGGRSDRGHLAVPPLPHHWAYGSRTTAVRRVMLGQEHEVEGDRGSRSSGCAGLVGPPDVRTCARNRSASRQQPPRGTLAGHAVVVL